MHSHRQPDSKQMQNMSKEDDKIEAVNLQQAMFMN
jgi:hypothetical protein